MNDKILAQGAGVKVSADTVQRNCASLISEGTITSADLCQILWLVTLMREESLSLAEAGKRIGYDASTISKVLSGKYTGNWDSVIHAIERSRHLAAERAKMASATFVETSIWESIRATCDLALVHQMPAILIGVSQIGKTTALLEYKRRSNYAIRYVRLPAAPGFRSCLEAIADACDVTTRVTTDNLRRRISQALDERTLLIIDELHQLAISTSQNTAMKVMEYIRELHDRTGCGLVVCGTKALETDLIHGRLAAWLDQFAQRCIKTCQLPNDLPWSDVLLVATSFGLGEPPEEATRCIKTCRMNRLTKVLGLARTLANNRSEPFTWAHFIAAYNLVNR